MTNYPVLALLAIAAVIAYGSAAAQGTSDPPSTKAPGVIVQGSGNVAIGGQPAARRGDATDQATVLIEGSPNVSINGRPAATLGGRTNCSGVTVGGSSNVFINGKPVARTGDLTTGCGGK